jgi:hypothetical protein
MMKKKFPHGLLSHIINGRVNVWTLREEDEEERE